MDGSGNLLSQLGQMKNSTAMYYQLGRHDRILNVVPHFMWGFPLKAFLPFIAHEIIERGTCI